jgi:lipopolysaccharide export LptBFGC system permease protein LptF
MTLPELRAAMTNGDPALSRRLRIQFHEKFAISFSCVIFGLFSIPLGIRLKRTGRFIGLSWSLLVIFFYYILLGISRNLGYEGTLNPGLAAWLPNLFFFLTGAVLFFQTSRRIPAGTAAGTRLGRMLQKIGRTDSTGGTGQP